MCANVHILNMKFLCLTMGQGEVCTDNADTNNTDDANDGQSMIVQGSLVDKPNEPKTSTVIFHHKSSLITKLFNKIAVGLMAQLSSI